MNNVQRNTQHACMFFLVSLSDCTCHAPLVRCAMGKATEATEGGLLEIHLRFCPARAAKEALEAVGQGGCGTELAGGYSKAFSVNRRTITFLSLLSQ